MASLSWEDLRFVLSIARHGSLKGAAQSLGLNVSTCSRRLNQLEADLQAVCFVRRPSGVELTPVGHIVLEHAEAMEKQAFSLQHALAASDHDLTAQVTVTCPDSLATALVIPALAKFLGSRPKLTVDIVTDNRVVDLNRGEADIALRLRRPDDCGLMIRKIWEITYGLYASAPYLERNAPLQKLDDLSVHQLIAVRTLYPNHAPAVWWVEQCRLGLVSVRTDRTLDREKCAAEELGVTMLPVAVGERSSLIRVLENVQLPSLEVFLLAQPGALRVPAVRDVAEQLAKHARSALPTPPKAGSSPCASADSLLA